MINSMVTALQLLLIVISSAIILYLLTVRGDSDRTTCAMFLIDLCLLWTVLI